MMSTMSTVVPLHLLGQDDQKEMQCDCFGHVMPLVSASVSCDVVASSMTPLHLFS